MLPFKVKRDVLRSLRSLQLCNLFHSFNFPYIRPMFLKRKILLFLLAISVALPKDFLEHVIEFPALVAHFIHHNHHAHISFTTFLTMHEKGTEHHNDNEPGHIPFNHQHSADCFQPNNFVGQVQFSDFTFLGFNNFKNAHRCYSETFTSSYCANFWQPPRLG